MAPETTEFHGVAFRYSNYDIPFWVRPNSEPGRWHRVGHGATQYLSTTVEGAWAELIRAEGLRSELEVELVRMPMWVAEIQVQRVADYGSFEKAERAGFSPEALIDDGYDLCQEEGLRLREAGYQGVLAPSAALDDTVNLTLFGARIASTWNSPPLLASLVPATKIAVGAPPEGIVGQVRQHGEDHRSFARHREAREDSRRKQSPED